MEGKMEGLREDGRIKGGVLTVGLILMFGIAVVTDEFLDFSASRGNDLRGIQGMKSGCKWCLCTNRWKEAMEAAKGTDDPVVPKSVYTPSLSHLYYTHPTRLPLMPIVSTTVIFSTVKLVFG